MIVVSKSFSAASVSLKIGTLILFICLIIHVVGFTVARWASVTISVANNGTGIQTFYHAGLWLHCGCVDLGEISCICYSRGGDPGMYLIHVIVVLLWWYLLYPIPVSLIFFPAENVDLNKGQLCHINVFFCNKYTYKYFV
jgi:hypothetical protein